MVMMVIVMEDESNIHERLGWSIMTMTLSYTIDDVMMMMTMAPMMIMMMAISIR